MWGTGDGKDRRVARAEWFDGESEELRLSWTDGEGRLKVGVGGVTVEIFG